VPRASLFLLHKEGTHTQRDTRDTYVHIYIFPDSLGIWNELRFGSLMEIDCSIWTFFFGNWGGLLKMFARWRRHDSERFMEGVACSFILTFMASY
jgi:hypothetical protein